MTLPPVADSIHGYHRECYRKFTALPLPKAHRVTAKSSCDTIQEKQSPLVDNLTTKSKEGTSASQPICLFCRSARKRN